MLLDFPVLSFNLVKKLDNQFVTKNDLVRLIITDFDFVAIRYGWEKGAGDDLDTLTGFDGINIDYVDGQTIGYPRSQNNIDIAHPENYVNAKGILYNSINKNVYMCHGGDNTLTGGGILLIFQGFRL